MTDQGATFANTVVCEDVREEIGNKKSLIGVLAGDLLVPSFPAHVQVAFYFEIKTTGKTAHKVWISLRLNGKEFLQLNGMIDPGGQDANMVAPKGFMVISEEAALSVFGRIDDGPEVQLVAKRVLAS